MKRLLITGSRYGWDEDALKQALFDALRELGTEDTILVHGAAPGVDAQAATIWQNWGLQDEPHPADWSIGKKAGPLRNQEMVDLGADLCLAFPAVDSRGTRHCLGAAQTAGIPTVVYEKE